MLSNGKIKKMFWYSCFLCKINVCLKRSLKWTKSYKQKAFSWFCISEKSKFPGKYQEQPYVQPGIFGGAFPVCTKGFGFRTYRRG